MNKKPVIYHLYLPSFKDGNGDGIGDFKGILEEINYIKSLNVDYVWLSPFYKSPNKDWGYDVSDYRDVSKNYGDMNLLRKIVNKFHSENIKIMIDIVFNHTSVSHEWFKRALKGEQKYMDYYHFFKPESKLINFKLKSVFGDNAFTFNKENNLYHYSTFSKYQPDLNWESQELRNELKKIIEFWVNFGIDGFRLDAFNMIGKDFLALLKHNNVWSTANHKNVKQWWNEILPDKNKKIYIIGECNASREGSLYFTKNSKIDSVFTLDHMDERIWKKGRFDLNNWMNLLYNKVPYVNNRGGDVAVAIDNHDNTRTIDEFDYENETVTRFLLANSVLNNSAACIYQGIEYGQTNPNFKDLSELRDRLSLNSCDENILIKGRENARVPLSWNSDEVHFGFSKSKPWLTNGYSKQFINKNSQIIFLNKMLKIRRKYELSKRKLKITKTNKVMQLHFGNKNSSIVVRYCLFKGGISAKNLNNEKIIFKSNASKEDIDYLGFVITERKKWKNIN